MWERVRISQGFIFTFIADKWIVYCCSETERTSWGSWAPYWCPTLSLSATESFALCIWLMHCRLHLKFGHTSWLCTFWQSGMQPNKSGLNASSAVLLLLTDWDLSHQRYSIVLLYTCSENYKTCWLSSNLFTVHGAWKIWFHNILCLIIIWKWILSINSKCPSQWEM